MLSPMSPNEDIINYSFSSSRNGILDQLVRIWLTSTTVLVRSFASWTLLSHKEQYLCHNQPGFFCFLFFPSHTSSLFLFPSAYKSLSFCTPPQSSFLSTRLDATWFASVLLKLLTFFICFSLSFKTTNQGLPSLQNFWASHLGFMFSLAFFLPSDRLCNWGLSIMVVDLIIWHSHLDSRCVPKRPFLGPLW